MSYNYDSSIVKEKTTGCNPVQNSVNGPDSSSVKVFPDTPEEEKTKETKQEEPEIRNFDIDKLVKKYKKNPMAVLNDIGINFSAEERKELEALLKDKKSLNAFLEIAKEGSLNPQDILAATKLVAGREAPGFFKRIGNTFKTLFKDGIAEAIKLVKSEKVYYSEKLSGNMGEIRDEREDFSSEGLAKIGQSVTDTPEIKDNVMHFVTKEEIDGKHLYTEEDNLKATEIMVEKPKDADLFTNNAVELESLGKYSGSTIINVDEKMIDNKELQPTMMKTAHKSDMDNENLIGITDNLVENPEMNGALNRFLDQKDKDGKDLFTASNIHSQSSYMVDKNSETINSYSNTTVALAKQGNLSGNQIINTAGVQSDTTIANKTSYSSPWANANGSANNSSQNVGTYGSNVNNPISKNKLTNKVASETYGSSSYQRDTILKYLQKKYGASAEKILQKMEENRSFVDLLKKYGGNRDIVNALIKDVSLVNKITRSSASITNDQLGDIVKLCTNPEKTEIMLNSIGKFGPMKAISMAEKITGSEDSKKILDILNENTTDITSKKEKIEDEVYGNGKDREFVC